MTPLFVVDQNRDSNVLRGLSSTKEKFVDTQGIIDQIDAQIVQLQKVRALLADTATPIRRKPGRPAGSGKVAPRATANAARVEKMVSTPVAVRTLSAEARERIATAQRARWAKSKAASKKAAKLLRRAEGEVAAKQIKPKTIAPKTAPVKKAVFAKKAGIRRAETAAVTAA